MPKMSSLFARLEKMGIEDTDDSDDFPQGPLSDRGGESDSPQHCGTNTRCANKIHIPGGSTIDCLRDCPLISLPRTALLLNYKQVSEIPIANSLIKILRFFKKKKKATIIPEIFTDCSYVYGGATTPEETILWRIEATDNGDYGELETVYLPSSESHERTLQDTIEEGISEGAWD